MCCTAHENVSLSLFQIYVMLKSINLKVAQAHYATIVQENTGATQVHCLDTAHSHAD